MEDIRELLDAKGLTSAQRAILIAQQFADSYIEPVDEELQALVELAIDAAVRDAVAPLAGGGGFRGQDSCSAEWNEPEADFRP